MDEQAQSLLATLKKSSASIDQKITLLNKVKSDIKHLRVPEAAQSTIFECLKLAISAQTSPTLVSTGLSTLPHFIKRLSLQEQPGIIATQVPKFLPILLERLCDQRESHRNSASQSIADFWPYNHVEVEKTIREGALAGHNARAKEMGMMWIVKVNREQGLQFKSFVPHLVACLEDADGMVRETAKSVIIELFSNAPDRAKADLQKQMAAKDVRKTIVSFIVAQLGLGHSVDMDMGSSIASAPSAQHLPEPTFGESAMADHSSEAQVEPLFVQSQRDLEDMFREMLPYFEGRESEHNWGQRDKSITKVRRLLVGNAPSEFHQIFMADIKSMLDGILKVSNSLRTTHSSNGCLLVQEMGKVLGHSLDPMVDLLLQTFIKMSANTKPIAANNGSSTTDILLSNVSYNKRLMEHMWFSYQDKNVQVRTYASGWLKTVITKHARSKAQIEHSGGLDLAEKCLKKGLADANPKVREGTRAVYWAFAQIWPSQAESIMESLDAKSKQLLEKDSHNPSSSSLASSISSTKSAVTQAKAGAFNGRQSVRDAIAAQKRAMAAKTDRPASAQSMASISSDIAPARSSAAPRAPASRAPASTSASNLTQTARTGGHGASSSASGSLMAAPVRRPGRRPEVARPATADPYATRKQVTEATPTMSPSNSPSKTKTSAPQKSSSRTPAPSRPKTPVAHSSVRSKSRLGESSLPRPSPKSKTTSTGSPMASPRQSHFSHGDIPYSQPPDDEAAHPPPSNPRRRHVVSEDLSPMDTSLNFEDVDNFTMVGIPGLSNLRNQPFDDRPLSRERPGSRDRPDSSHDQTQSVPIRPSPSKMMGMQNHSNSPLNRLRSPPSGRSPRTTNGQSQLRNGEVDHSVVQIYEDPPSSDENQANIVEEDVMSPVLEELPLNERASDQNISGDREIDVVTARSHDNEHNAEMPSTPRQENKSHQKSLSTGSNVGVNVTPNVTTKNADVFRSRRLIGSGIERIRSRTLDVHGLRRIQDLVKNGGDIWGDDNERYGELLITLLEYLESPMEGQPMASNEKPSTPSTSRGANLKVQVLATVRAMLSLHKREAAPYLSQSLVAILKAKAQFDDASHVAAEMERSVEEIVRQSTNATECIDAVTSLLESVSVARDHAEPFPSSPHSDASTPSSDASSPSTHNTSSKTSRTIVLSLSALSQLLAKTDMSSEYERRLGALAVRYLDDSEADVRKADLEFCLSCYGMLGKEVFWKQFLKGAREMHVNLMMYYLARRKRA